MSAKVQKGTRRSRRAPARIQLVKGLPFANENRFAPRRVSDDAFDFQGYMTVAEPHNASEIPSHLCLFANESVPETANETETSMAPLDGPESIANTTKKSSPKSKKSKKKPSPPNDTSVTSDDVPEDPLPIQPLRRPGVLDLGIQDESLYVSARLRYLNSGSEYAIPLESDSATETETDTDTDTDDVDETVEEYDHEPLSGFKDTSDIESCLWSEKCQMEMLGAARLRANLSRQLRKLKFEQYAEGTPTIGSLTRLAITRGVTKLQGRKRSDLKDLYASLGCGRILFSDDLAKLSQGPSQKDIQTQATEAFLAENISIDDGLSLDLCPFEGPASPPLPQVPIKISPIRDIVLSTPPSTYVEEPGKLTTIEKTPETSDICSSLITPPATVVEESPFVPGPDLMSEWTNATFLLDTDTTANDDFEPEPVDPFSLDSRRAFHAADHSDMSWVPADQGSLRYASQAKNKSHAGQAENQSHRESIAAGISSDRQSPIRRATRWHSKIARLTRQLDTAHHPNGCPIRNCPWAVVNFPSRTAYNSHMDIVHGAATVPCGICSKQFSRRDALLRHERSAHFVELSGLDTVINDKKDQRLSELAQEANENVQEHVQNTLTYIANHRNVFRIPSHSSQHNSRSLTWLADRHHAAMIDSQVDCRLAEVSFDMRMAWELRSKLVPHIPQFSFPRLGKKKVKKRDNGDGKDFLAQANFEPDPEADKLFLNPMQRYLLYKPESNDFNN